MYPMHTNWTYVESHACSIPSPAVWIYAMVNEISVTKTRFSTKTESMNRYDRPSNMRIAARSIIGTGRTSWMITLVQNAAHVPEYQDAGWIERPESSIADVLMTTASTRSCTIVHLSQEHIYIPFSPKPANDPVSSDLLRNISKAETYDRPAASRYRWGLASMTSGGSIARYTRSFAASSIYP